MKKMNVFFVWILFCCAHSFANDFINKMKGVGNSFKDFGDSVAQMAQGMGAGFGAAPTGYVYHYTVVNDTAVPIYMNTKKIGSFMGAYFQVGSTEQDIVQPFSNDFKVLNKEYYFEVTMNATGYKSSSRMPYTNADALYVQDCIQLPQHKNSTKMNFFHVYMGKDIANGYFVHSPKIEYMGYADWVNTSDKNNISMQTVLTGTPALSVYNSTSDDLIVGYSSKFGIKSLAKSDCDLFITKIEKNSFLIHSGLLNAAKKMSTLPLGTFGIFSQIADTTTELFVMPTSVFGGQTYTIEIYQDAGQKRNIGLQALSSAHDVPAGRVKDITPVSCVFWYQSVTQLDKSQTQGYIDLPGQVWIVSQSKDNPLVLQVPLGKAIQFEVVRPELGKIEWLYFVYVEEQDTSKVNQFLQNFVSEKIGTDVVAAYKNQGVTQFENIQEKLSDIITVNMNQKKSMLSNAKISIPESLLEQAIQGSLQVNRGKIEDPDLKMTGYLLGADVFTSQGIGSLATLYYQLLPSQQLPVIVPTSSVVNGYVMGITSAPKGMPMPTVYGKK